MQNGFNPYSFPTNSPFLLILYFLLGVLELFIEVDHFQGYFLYGAINGLIYEITEKEVSKFKFLYGAINGY